MTLKSFQSLAKDSCSFTIGPSIWYCNLQFVSDTFVVWELSIIWDDMSFCYCITSNTSDTSDTIESDTFVIWELLIIWDNVSFWWCPLS